MRTRLRLCAGTLNPGNPFPEPPVIMRIAKPILLTMTPIGVAWGLVEAWRFRPILAVLMFLLLSVISLFIWMTVKKIRDERSNQ